MAFDLEQPWACHQTYRILDELHGEIYARPEVNAHRIFAINLVGEAVVKHSDGLENKLLASYRLTRYFLIYLVRLALERDATGKEFCRDPGPFVSEVNGPDRILSAIAPVVKDLIVDLNAEVRDRADDGNPLDFKRELKSPNPVRELSKGVIPQYQKAVNRGRANSFGTEWQQ